jgi:hypothetical protein
MSLWEAREATVKIGDFVASVTSASTLLQYCTGTDFSGECKNISITGGERDLESVPLLGTTDGYTNQEIVQKSVGSLREISMTLIYKDTDTSIYATGTVTAPAGYQRIQGDQDVTKRSVCVSFNDGEDYVNVLLNNAYSVKVGDIKLDADGHAEQEIVFKCLAKDYYEEDNL